MRFAPSSSFVSWFAVVFLGTVGSATAQPLVWALEHPAEPQPHRLKVLNLATGGGPVTFEAPPGVRFGWEGSVTPDGRFYLLPTSAGIARFRTNPIEFDRMIAPGMFLYHLSVAPTGTRLHAIGSNGRAVVDWESGAVISTDCCNTSAVYFTPDGSIRLEIGPRPSAGSVDTVAAFLESTGALLWENEIDLGVGCAVGAANNSYFAMYCHDWDFISEVIIWNVSSGVERRRLETSWTAGLAWEGERLLMSQEAPIQLFVIGFRLTAYNPQTESMSVMAERPGPPLSFAGRVVVSPDTRHAYWQTQHLAPRFDTNVTLYDVIDLASGTVVGTGQMEGFQGEFDISESACHLDVPATVAAPTEGGVVGIPVVPDASCFAWSVPGQPAVLNPGPHVGAATVLVQTWANALATEKATTVSIGSQTVVITQPSGVPAAPTLEARVVGDRVALSWTLAVGAGIESFVVRGAVAGSPITDVFELPGHLRTWTSPPLAPGSYHVELAAANGAGRSPASNSRSFSIGVSAAPETPIDVAAAVADDRVAISWAPAPDGPAPAGFVIEAARAGSSSFDAVARSDGASFVATRVPAGAWQVRVRAATAGGVSPPSDAVTVNTAPCSAPPAAPQLPWALWTPPAVTLRWSPPATGSVEDYVIEVGSATGLADLGWVVVPGTELSSTQDVSVPAAAYVRVRARNACGESAASAEVPIVVY